MPNHFNDDPIEADHEGSTLDSSDTSSVCTDTTSVTSSAFEYQYENGRRYHAYRAGKYLLPNDEEEQDRLDMQHHLWSLNMRGELISAPLKKSEIKQVLDLGTGTGSWAVDFADEYPDCEVIGTDLSPIQPTWVPPNVKFIIDDFEDTWAFEENKFDLVHGRMMIGSVKNWPEFFKNCYRHIRPGGYFELQEYDIFELHSDDGTLDKVNSATAKYYSKITEGMKLLGCFIDFTKIEDDLKKAGFTDVTVRSFKTPVSHWAKNPTMKERGRLLNEIIKSGLEAYGLAMFTRVMGMEEGEAKKLIEAAVKENGDLSIHMYARGYIVYAKKGECE